MSDPVAMELVPAAREAADPPDEPPGVSCGFHGLRVTPQSRELVYPAQENSGVAVRAWTKAPARRIRWLFTEVVSATKSYLSKEPFEVGLPLI